MLFRKKMPRSCAYCAYAAALGDNQMLCMKRGEVSAFFECRKFRYDPCKRIPPQPRTLDTEEFRDEDFSL